MAWIKHGVPQGSILHPLLFLIYMNDLPRFINNKSIFTVFADYTSKLFAYSNTTEFIANKYIIFGIINIWFKDNYLS
jgi:hypothetical protein